VIKLVPISSDPIRKKWVSHYHQIEKKLAKLKRSWNAFENDAQTSYQRWYHQTFAGPLSQLNGIGEEVHELRTILSAIQAQVEVNGHSKKSAFLYVMEAIQSKRDPFPTPTETESFKAKRARIYEQAFKANHSPEGLEDIDSELLERARFMVMEKVRMDFPDPPDDPIELMFLNREIDAAIHGVYEKLKNTEVAQEEQSVLSNPKMLEDHKTLYRKIVKRLHPDRGLEMSREEKGLWSEAQKAYRERNIEMLRTILLRIEGDGLIQIDTVESVGEIIEIVCSLHSEYEQINFVQRRTKKEWVYRFWASKNRAKNREKLASEIQNQLGRRLAYARYELGELQREWNRLKLLSEKKRR